MFVVNLECFPNISLIYLKCFSKTPIIYCFMHTDEETQRNHGCTSVLQSRPHCLPLLFIRLLLLFLFWSFVHTNVESGLVRFQSLWLMDYRLFTRKVINRRSKARTWPESTCWCRPKNQASSDDISSYKHRLAFQHISCFIKLRGNWSTEKPTQNNMIVVM